MSLVDHQRFVQDELPTDPSRDSLAPCDALAATSQRSSVVARVCVCQRTVNIGVCARDLEIVR